MESLSVICMIRGVKVVGIVAREEKKVDAEGDIGIKKRDIRGVQEGKESKV